MYVCTVYIEQCYYWYRHLYMLHMLYINLSMYSTCTCIYSMCILAQVYGAPDLYLHLQVHFEGVEQSQEDGEGQLHNLRHAGDTIL